MLVLFSDVIHWQTAEFKALLLFSLSSQLCSARSSKINH